MFLKLIKILKRNEYDYINKYRFIYFDIMTFTFYKQKKDISRIDRLYAQSSLIQKCKK